VEGEGAGLASGEEPRLTGFEAAEVICDEIGDCVRKEDERKEGFERGDVYVSRGTVDVADKLWPRSNQHSLVRFHVILAPMHTRQLGYPVVNRLPEVKESIPYRMASANRPILFCFDVLVETTRCRSKSLTFKGNSTC
jgi:hypothetical protein